MTSLFFRRMLLIGAYSGFIAFGAGIGLLACISGAVPSDPDPHPVHLAATIYASATRTGAMSYAGLCCGAAVGAAFPLATHRILRRRTSTAAGAGLIHRKLDRQASDRLVDSLLAVTVRRLPVEHQARFAEEWSDHRTHHHGWRLLWWASCVFATAAHTNRELRQVELPQAEQ